MINCSAERIQSIDNFLGKACEDGSAPCSQICVISDGQIVYQNAFGWIDPPTRHHRVGSRTLFDLASVTKLFTTAAFLRIVDAGMQTLDAPLSSVLEEFQGQREIKPFEEPLYEGKFRDVSQGYKIPVDAGKTTFRQILTHTSGLPAWRPFYTAVDRDQARKMVLDTFFSYKPESDVVYSDIGFILLGWAVEKISGMRLDKAIQKMVVEPLKLDSLCFRPLDSHHRAMDSLPAYGIAPTEICHWRKKRLNGEVDDENSAFLGGIAGHAGVFATAVDLAKFGTSFLTPDFFLSAKLLQESVSVQTVSTDGKNRRGLGFQCWSPDAEASYAPLSSLTFGHTGFTGTCLWVDPQTQTAIALLTNEVYNGRYDRKIAALRMHVMKQLGG